MRGWVLKDGGGVGATVMSVVGTALDARRCAACVARARRDRGGTGWRYSPQPYWYTVKEKKGPVRF